MHAMVWRLPAATGGWRHAAAVQSPCLEPAIQVHEARPAAVDATEAQVDLLVAIYAAATGMGQVPWENLQAQLISNKRSPWSCPNALLGTTPADSFDKVLGFKHAGNQLQPSRAFASIDLKEFGIRPVPVAINESRLQASVQ